MDFQFMARGIVEDSSGKYKSLNILVRNKKRYLLTRGEVAQIKNLISDLDEFNERIPVIMERLSAAYEDREVNIYNHPKWAMSFSPKKY